MGILWAHTGAIGCVVKAVLVGPKEQVGSEAHITTRFNTSHPAMVA